MTTVDERGKPELGHAVLILARDLFIRVRLESAVSRAGCAPVFLGPNDDVATIVAQVRPALALVDLQAPPAAWRSVLGAARLAPSGPVPAVAFGSHKDLSVRKDALAAGATAVVANSKLARDLSALLSRHAKTTPDAG